MSSKRSDEGEGAFKRNLTEDEDVEGHSMVRGGDGAISRRDADLDEGATSRSLIADDEEDVEGHSMVRGGDGVISRGDGVASRGAELGEGAIGRKIGPGEGHSSRT